MDSPSNNKENVSNSSKSIRAELLKKNQVAAPKKHRMCKDLFIKYLEEKHPAAFIPRYMYPASKKLLTDVIIAGFLDWY